MNTNNCNSIFNYGCPKQTSELSKKIPDNYNTYSVRVYVSSPMRTCSFTVETDYIEDADGNYRWTDYKVAKRIFIDALKNADYIAVDLTVTTADEDDDSPMITVEQWKKMREVPTPPEDDEDK